MNVRSIFRNGKVKMRLALVKTILTAMKTFGVSPDYFNKYYIPFLVKENMINNHLLLNYESCVEQSYFIQYLPDRYSCNLNKYHKSFDFFSYLDLKKWIEGNYYNNVGDFSRFFLFNLCIDTLIDDKIEGDVIEVGVYRGNSAFLLSKYAQRTNRICYLFDTFEGFDSRDLNGIDKNVSTSIFTDTSLEAVEKVVGKRNTVYVKGFFPDSLIKVGELNDLSLVHLDCDLEAPFMSSLNYFYPRIKKGGFLIMHDYSSLYWPGAKKAIDMFFADKLEFIVPIPDKSGTCIVRKV
jgi:hypothetical protein